MSITVALEDLLNYSDLERRKWEAWLTADPSRLRLPLQGTGRFPSVAELLDHIFLVERRHLARLEGATPPDSTGVPAGDAAALFEYARLVRADLREYVASIDDALASEPMTVVLPAGSYVMPRRQLAVHIFLHEVRHLAQLALAARLAGQAPPGEHDIFYMK